MAKRAYPRVVMRRLAMKRTPTLVRKVVVDGTAEQRMNEAHGSVRRPLDEPGAFTRSDGRGDIGGVRQQRSSARVEDVTQHRARSEERLRARSEGGDLRKCDGR